MTIAINDISFRIGFRNKYDAQQALIQFGDVALGLRDERVSGVNARIDVVNSVEVGKNLMLAPEYTLMQALNDIKVENRERYLFILQLLSQCGADITDYQEELEIRGLKSKHCAFYRDDFLLSICSVDIFGNEVVEGELKSGQYCALRNLADDDHKYIYWKELGFREYELNKKHGTREYYRPHGKKVNIAPETDELGQKLLNSAVEVEGRLFSVDWEHGERIFEFRHSYANKFHGYKQEDITADMIRRIKDTCRGKDSV